MEGIAKIQIGMDRLSEQDGAEALEGKLSDRGWQAAVIGARQHVEVGLSCHHYHRDQYK